MISVLVTEDSELSWNIMKAILESDPQIKVVGWAKNGRECIDQVKRLKPNVITMDIHMPVMDGYETTQYIMENMPTSILVVSALVKHDENMVFKLLKVGALDVIEKPKRQKTNARDYMSDDVVQKVKAVAKVLPIKKFHEVPEEFIHYEKQNRKKFSQIDAQLTRERKRVLVIGASTGGPPVLNYILSRIPNEFSFPILITQHIVHGFVAGLAEWLEKECLKKVKIGIDHEPIQSGRIYLAPGNYHMGVTKDGEIFLSDGVPVSGHRPSVDFLMESAALAYGEACMGVLLTGMGCDGANGLLAIKNKGGFTIAQDEKTSAIFGMPKAAFAISATRKVCSKEQIPSEVLQWDIREKFMKRTN